MTLLKNIEAFYVSGVHYIKSSVTHIGMHVKVNLAITQIKYTFHLLK